jgi:hypothetical protein
MAVGDPTGEDLCVGTTDGNTLPVYSGSELRQITFGSSYSLVAGTKYAVVIRALTNNYDFMLDWWGDSLPYSGGKPLSSGDGGVTWSEVQNFDDSFITYSGSNSKDLYLGASGVSSGPKTFWMAQTFTAGSDYDITSVRLFLSRDSDVSIGIVTVSIRATEGAVPSKAITPAPVNTAEDIGIRQPTITWENGGGATSYDVYFGTVSGGLSLVSSNQVATSFSLSGLIPFDYRTIYYWRIDSKNVDGTTTGDEWKFTSIQSPWFMLMERRSDYNPNQVWQPTVGWVDIEDFEYTGGGRFKNRVVVIGHNVIYFGDA